jgi:hypothetical protein
VPLSRAHHLALSHSSRVMRQVQPVPCLAEAEGVSGCSPMGRQPDDLGTPAPPSARSRTTPGTKTPGPPAATTTSATALTATPPTPSPRIWHNRQPHRPPGETHTVAEARWLVREGLLRRYVAVPAQTVDSAGPPRGFFPALPITIHL